MAKLFVVVNSLSDWSSYYPSENVITVTDYLHLSNQKSFDRAQVINLCRSYKYQSKGYYCSLLAEAREHRVIPSVRAINDISRKSIYSLEIEDFESKVKISNLDKDAKTFSLQIYFGKSQYKELEDLSRKIFEVFSFPIIKVKFTKQKEWQIESIKPISISNLLENEEDLFASALDEFSKKIWRKPRAKKSYLYDLAILHNPDEKLPPSNKSALNQFCKAGKRLGINVDLITRDDYMHLSEYDGLFIRETTNLNNHTYMFAKKAESLGMVVMDDPNSILKCTNKVYLSNLLEINGVRSPKTMVLDKEDSHFIEKLEKQISYPIVLKIPDGSFSVGVVRVSNREELIQECSKLFEKTYLLIAQEYLFTEYDWRIGILNKRLLYSCKYFMSKGHWQIIEHSGSGKIKTGNVQSYSLQKVPKEVLKVALKSANLIGNSLYGVDIKIVDDKPVVIEINDNPNIDYGVEDEFLGEDLYTKIMEEFLRRLD